MCVYEFVCLFVCLFAIVLVFMNMLLLLFVCCGYISTTYFLPFSDAPRQQSYLLIRVPDIVMCLFCAAMLREGPAWYLQCRQHCETPAKMLVSRRYALGC